MAFDYDVFISYAHLDNEPLLEGERGWVSEFHDVLEKRLAMLLGERPRIWRDRELRGNHVFDETIARGFTGAALFLSIVTPRYVRSDYCQLELEEFCRIAEAHGGLTSEDRSRIVKVLKTPVGLQEQPPPMDRLLGYEFFRLDPDAQRLRELRVASREDREQFLAILEDVAQSIKEALELLRNGQGPTVRGAGAGQPGTTVYLAPTTSDRKEDREALLRELRERGSTVLPERPLPVEAEALEEAVRRDLERSELSIHIVGERHGVVPEDEDRSVVQIQNDLAAEISAARGFERILWMPAGLEARDPRQQALIETLRTDPAAQRNAALLETGLEDLKAEVLDRLERHRRPPEEDAGDGEAEGPPWVYLLHAACDADAVTPLVDLLFDRGLEVRTPLFEGTEAELREEHEENLQLCDAFLLYYGAARERWLRKALGDLRKARGLGRIKPVRAKAVYLAPPESPAKERFRTHEAPVLRGEAEPSADAVRPFLDSLEAAP